MKSVESSVVVIVNPTAGVRGRAIGRRIVNELPPATWRYTRYPGHGIELGRQAADDGFRTIIAVGGDGTLNEVANGILTSAGSGDVRLGFVAAGTCNDFARKRAVAGHLRELLDPRRDLEVDVGNVTFLKSDGTEASRFFLVNCTAGIISKIAEGFTRKTAANWILRHLSLQLAEAASSTRVIAGWRALEMCIDLDHESSCHRITNLAVMKIPYFAGGLSFGAADSPDDGYLKVVQVSEMGRVDLAILMWKLLRRTAAGHPALHSRQVCKVRIDSDIPVPLEVDGEVVGKTPAVFSVHPVRLRTVL